MVADAGTAPWACADGTKDTNALCAVWRNAGDCNGPAANYTRSQCPQSCGICSGGSAVSAPVVCEDKDALCPNWKAVGDCNNAAATFTRQQCPKSCGVCSGGSQVASPTPGGMLHSIDSGMCKWHVCASGMDAMTRGSFPNKTTSLLETTFHRF